MFNLAVYWPNYWHNQIEEIRSDKILCYYGIAMAAIHVLAALWLLDFGAAQILQIGSEPICWPFFSECKSPRILSSWQLEYLFISYGLLAILVGFLFINKRLITWAYTGLILINLIKFMIVLIDFRLRLNQHYMGLFINLVYLFVPQKRTALPWMIALFYFWAGTIKLNMGWISGDALLGRLPLFKGDWLVASCIYVLVLELILVWGLIARRSLIFWACLPQFIAFHIISWWVVGFFYPMLMFAILSLFIIERLFSDVQREAPKIPVYLMIAMFSVLQIVPYALSVDPKISGEGRVYALHMFDAPHRCKVFADLKLADGKIFRQNLRLKTSHRIACDPLVYYHRAKNLCREREKNQIEFSDFDLALLVGENFAPLIDIKNFCSQNIQYKALSHNDWIKGV